MPFKSLEHQRAWQARNREKVSVPSAKYRQKRSAAGVTDSVYYRKRRYGVTPEVWAEMLERQGGVCALCEEKKELHVDHCHETKKVRGLLCMTCNTALGKFKDDPEVLRRAIAYIECN
jgi:hypothetical protein